MGFDPSEDFAGRFGPTLMRERATRLGGTLTIESIPGAGTDLTPPHPPPTAVGTRWVPGRHPHPQAGTR